MSKIKLQYPLLQALILKGIMQNQQRLLLPLVIFCGIAPGLSINITNSWTDWSIFVMAVTLFLLGRPGSGKSTAARYIEHLALQRGWSVLLLDDYKFLQAMFHADTDHKQFRPAGPPGCDAFDVLDFSVLNTVLGQIEQATHDHLHREHELILIEFARDEYREPLQLFRRDFLHRAYFLYFEANLDICMQRIQDRAAYPATRNDHFVSEDILCTYYRKDNKNYIASTFAIDFSLERERIAIVDNMGSWKEFATQVKSFIDYVITREERAQQQTPTAQFATSMKDTGPLSNSSLHYTSSEENPVQAEAKRKEMMHYICPHMIH